MRKHFFGSLAAVLALAVCAGLIWFNFFRQEMIGQFFASQKPPSQVVSTIEVTPDTWTPGIVAIGTARAAQGVQLAVQINGVVKQIAFEANDKVDKDQLLVQLDDAVERADLIDAEAAVKVAQAAERRSRRLRTSGFDSEAAFDKVTADLDAALSKLARTKAAIELKSLEAPFAGTIGIPRIEVGEYVSAGTVVATLQDLDHISVDFAVPEQFIAQVTMGQTVRFGFVEEKLGLSGRITGIDPRGDPQTRLVSVRADITDDAGEVIIPGRFLHVRIDLPAEPNVIAVPQTSVVTSLYGDYVYKVVPDDREGAAADGKMLRQVFVKTGRREGQGIEILDGLAQGDVIVTAGQNKLQPGASVEVDNSIDITKATASQ
ncbi:MAG: efflux RND transporter periplasmic adaptor subunit [Anderseniella sp.]|jgi:membrane fusion protein (multidrug efflux system)|nr:efflux RND transporter periplasmic adaptor subunit [Anderseniella sp.]